MASRVEITSRYAKAYLRAGKAEKGRVLDEVVSVTGWSRDNARRRLVAAARRPAAGRKVATRVRKQRATRFPYDAVKPLQRVWAASGGQCGKYLAIQEIDTTQGFPQRWRHPGARAVNRASRASRAQRRPFGKS